MAIRLTSRARAYIRRAKAHGVDFEEFEPEEIFRRDGFLCMQYPDKICGCGKRARTNVPADHPDFATLGHFPAMSCGGPHFRANVFTQRWECNQRQNQQLDTPTASKIKRQRRQTGPQSEHRMAKKKEWAKRPFEGSRSFSGAVKRKPRVKAEKRV